MGINRLHRQYCAGDESVRELLFQLLSERFQIFVRQRIRNEQDAEEIVQDSLMTVSAKLEDTEIEISFAAWAYRILQNKILTFYRDSSSNRDKLEMVAEKAASVEPYIPDPALKSRLLECLRAVAAANIRHARILNLHYQGFSVEEICHKLKLSRNNLYIMLSRGRAAMRDCLKKKGEG